jgi:hypothetical protein
VKGVFLKNRGLRELAKINFLRDIAVEKDLVFIACSKQTKEIDFCGGRVFFWHLVRLEADHEVFTLGLTYLFLW